MSTSLRDQLLKAGLVNKRQVNEAERQQQRHERQPQRQERQQPQRQERQPPPQQRHESSADRSRAPQVAQSAKVARDLALNRRQQEKAEKKARHAQIKQMIEQNRLPPVEEGESYNFVDGAKIRRIAINAPNRSRLMRGEIVIVRHDGRYDLVPAPIAARIRERDEQVFIASGEGKSAAGEGKEPTDSDAAYEGYTVPDDLIW